MIDMIKTKAEKYATIHRQAFEIDKLGAIETYWQDDNGDICVKYACGDWYHYRINEKYKTLEWW